MISYATRPICVRAQWTRSSSSSSSSSSRRYCHYVHIYARNYSSVCVQFFLVLSSVCPSVGFFDVCICAWVHELARFLMSGEIIIRTFAQRMNECRRIMWWLMRCWLFVVNVFSSHLYDDWFTLVGNLSITNTKPFVPHGCLCETQKNCGLDIYAISPRPRFYRVSARMLSRRYFCDGRMLYGFVVRVVYFNSKDGLNLSETQALQIRSLMSRS